MKHKSLSILFFYCILGQSIAQNLSGEWIGYLDQTAAAMNTPGYQIYWQTGEWLSDQKTHELKLTLEASEKGIKGVYDINSINNKNHSGLFTIAGTFNGKVLKYETTNLIAETRDSLSLGNFCYNKAALYYYVEGDYEVLECNWEGWVAESKCAMAWVQVKRKKAVDVNSTTVVIDRNNNTFKDSTDKSNTLQLTTNINSLQTINLELYPNPNNGEFTIQFENKQQVMNLTVTIKNSIGQIIFIEDLPDFEGLYVKPIALNKLESGLYFVSLHSPNGLISKKMIVE